MKGMFFGCSSLKELNINGFDTSKIKNMYGIFGSCYSFEIICSDELKEKIEKYG